MYHHQVNGGHSSSKRQKTQDMWHVDHLRFSGLAIRAPAARGFQQRIGIGKTTAIDRRFIGFSHVGLDGTPVPRINHPLAAWVWRPQQIL